VIVALLVVLGGLALASAVPHPRRTLARAALFLYVLALPVLLAGWAISRWPKATFASYLALVPVIVTWACILDANGGLSDRLARTRAPRRARKPGDPPPAASGAVDGR
jgi:hypothetical protein